MSDQLSSDLASLRIQRDAPPSRSRLGLIIGALAFLAVAVAGYVIGMPYLEAKIFRPEVTAAEILVVSPAEAAVDLTASGYVVAETTSKVGAKVSGRISKIFVKEGESVKLSAPIAELEASDQESAIAASRARMVASKAKAETARATLAETKIQLDRQIILAGKGAAAKSTVEDLEARMKSLDESVKAADAEVDAIEAEMKTQNVQLQHTKILAPIAGTVVEKIADVGELVGPTTAAIVELADFSSLIVEIDVPEGRLHRVKIGGPGEIVLDAYPGRRYRGETSEIVPRVNKSKATVPVKVKFVDAPENVLPGMAARVSFLSKALDADSMKEPPKNIVPASAVVERAGAKIVFVIEGDMVRMVPVTLGPPFGNGFELKEGPPPGARVVKNPPETMFDGQRIKERNS